MSLTDPKHPLASRGVWGGLVAVAGGLGGLFGWSIAPEDAVQLPILLASISSGVGGVLAIVGRIGATRAIK